MAALVSHRRGSSAATLCPTAARRGAYWSICAFQSWREYCRISQPDRVTSASLGRACCGLLVVGRQRRALFVGRQVFQRTRPRGFKTQCLVRIPMIVQAQISCDALGASIVIGLNAPLAAISPTVPLLRAWSRLFSLGDSKRSAHFLRSQEGRVITGRGVLHAIFRQRKGKLIGRVGKAEAASGAGMSEHADSRAHS